MKIAIIDVETTGLDPLTHEIIEIGAVVFDTKEIDDFMTFSVKVKPEHPETGHPKAFEVNGYSLEEWEHAYSLEYAMKELTQFAQGATFCANNMIFDWGFLSEASKKTNIPLSFHYRKIDLFSMAWAKIPHHEMANSWSLKSLCQKLGVLPEPDIHRAINGAMKEYAVYKELMK